VAESGAVIYIFGFNYNTCLKSGPYPVVEQNRKALASSN